MRWQRKGVSDVVTTVLLILITVIAVAGVSAFIIRAIRSESGEVGAFGACTNLEITATRCVYDRVTAPIQTQVLIKRGSKGAEAVLNNVTVLLDYATQTSEELLSPVVPAALESIAPVFTVSTAPTKARVIASVFDADGSSVRCAAAGIVTCEQGRLVRACGDGIVQSGEECGEPGLAACGAGSSCIGCVCTTASGTPPQVPVCGNNVVENGEECDDGNAQELDGCDTACRLNVNLNTVAGGLNNLYDIYGPISTSTTCEHFGDPTPTTCDQITAKKGSSVSIISLAHDSATQQFSWSGACSGTPSSSDSCTITMDSTKNARVDTTPLPLYTLLVRMHPTAQTGLYVTDEEGKIIYCYHTWGIGEECSVELPANTIIDLSSYDDLGEADVGPWAGCLDMIDSNTCRVTMSGSITLTVPSP